MNVPSRSPVPAPACHYCGAVSRAELSFCPNCGAPLRPVESVLPPLPRPYLSDRTRVRLLAPHAARVFWAYFAVILGGGVVGAVIFEGDETDLRFQVFFSLLFSAFTFVYAAVHFEDLTSQFRRGGFGTSAIWVAGLVLAPLLLVNHLYHNVFLEWAGIGELMEGEGYGEIFRSFGALVFFVCVVPALTEEIGYQGLIQEWLQRALTPRKAIGLAAFLFGISHFSVVSLPYLFAVGLLLGWLKWKTGSLYPSMVIHFLHNFVVIRWLD